MDVDAGELLGAPGIGVAAEPAPHDGLPAVDVDLDEGVVDDLLGPDALALPVVVAGGDAGDGQPVGAAVADREGARGDVDQDALHLAARNDGLELVLDVIGRGRGGQAEECCQEESFAHDGDTNEGASELRREKERAGLRRPSQIRLPKVIR